MLKYILFVVVGLLPFGVSASLLAGNWMEPSDYFRENDIAFIGKVIDKKSESGKCSATFSVLKQYKGGNKNNIVVSYGGAHKAFGPNCHLLKMDYVYVVMVNDPWFLGIGKHKLTKKSFYRFFNHDEAALSFMQDKVCRKGGCVIGKDGFLKNVWRKIKISLFGSKIEFVKPLQVKNKSYSYYQKDNKVYLGSIELPVIIPKGFDVVYSDRVDYVYYKDLNGIYFVKFDFDCSSGRSCDIVRVDVERLEYSSPPWSTEFVVVGKVETNLLLKDDRNNLFLVYENEMLKVPNIDARFFKVIDGSIYDKDSTALVQYVNNGIELVEVIR